MKAIETLRAQLAALGLEAAVVRDIEFCFHAQPIRKKEVFLRAGEVDGRLGFVADGLFVMETVHEDGRLFIKDFLPKGAFMLGAFNPEQSNLVTFRALKNSMILEARYQEVHALFDKHPSFGDLAHRGMERRYETLCARLEQLAGMDASARYRAFQQAFREIEKDIPLGMAAAYLNITPTQLSRIRRKKKQESST
jgi:CRP-like cAMP-binding protein